jgi:tight adherence protein B
MSPQRTAVVAGLATVITFLLVILPARAQTNDLDLAIRDTRLAADGTTEIVVNVTGSAKPDVLGPDAFVVLEQGEEVQDLAVEPFLESTAAEAESIVLALAIDVSGSMRGDAMDLTKAAAADLVRDLAPRGVLIQLLSFEAEVRVLTQPTGDVTALVAAIESLDAAGETALYDAVAAGATQLAGVEGQRNLIVFSDGADTTSSSTLEQAVAASAGIELPVTLVALDTPDLDPEALDRIAADTGGRVLTAADTSELELVFEQVASDIASQYLLSYVSARHEPSNLDLEVRVAASGAVAERLFTVANLRDAPPTAPPTPRTFAAPEPSPLASPAVLYGGILAAFVAFLLLFAFLFASARTRADRVLGDQLARYIEGRDVRAGRSSLVAAHFRDRAMDLLESAPRPKGFDEKLSHRLEQAAWPLRNSEFLAMIILGALGVGIVVGVVFNPRGGLLLGIVAGSVPIAVLSIRRSRRLDAFLRHLPDTLQLLAGSLRAGYAVLQAIDSVAKESEPPTSEEFGRVLTEARLGMPLEDALEAMALRIDSDDFRWVVLAINIQREVGGNLAELLDTVAEVLREREMLRRQIKVLSAEGRLSAIILIALPIFLTLYLILVRPDYISALVTSGLFGWSMVVGASVLMLAGVVWIRNLIRIEV